MIQGSGTEQWRTESTAGWMKLGAQVTSSSSGQRFRGRRRGVFPDMTGSLRIAAVDDAFQWRKHSKRQESSQGKNDRNIEEAEAYGRS